MRSRAFRWLKHVFAPSSLRLQLLSRSLLVLAGLLFLIGLFQYVLMKDFIYKNKASTMQSQVMSVPRDAWQQFGNQPPNGQQPGPGGPNRGFFFLIDSTLALIDNEGKFTVLSNGPGSIPPPQLPSEDYAAVMQQKQPKLNYKIIVDSTGEEQLVVLQPVLAGRGGNRQLGVAQVSMTTKQLKDVLFRQLTTFLLLSFAAMVFALLAFLPVLRKTLVPLSNMVDSVERIDAGNLAARFPAKQGQMEIDRLADSFNGMLERLGASFEAEKEAKEQMRRFIADASHELRTPLTSIHGFLEVLLRGAASQPDQLYKSLTSMYLESERLNKLVHDLLQLAKLDRDRVPHFHLADGFLDAVILEMEPQLRMLAGSRNVSLAVSPGMKCSFEPDKMKQVILNLFQNAVQHTDPEKGRIEIRLAPGEGGLLLSVQDNGPGIHTEHLPHVFDRFYRNDTSRTRKNGGAGLGLAITKSIVEAHGGTIRVSSKEGEGAAFYVRLPAVTERA